ncbi:MAG TPA: gamma-glutamyl-gamma-aminobutyrate hydrolase family protein [Bryobacteraceae bacterium]|jgi:putative glutamine amidotransferase|nr:gamma-glutamyl-gamma-aminobutyrate hydrolase family protein [Bryobacteraceae bacterium]
MTLSSVSKKVLVIYREADKVVPYRDALVAAGIDPVLQGANVSLSLDGFEGLVLTGGPDVDPELYGETRHPETDEPDGERDALEASLLKEALARDLPILAICRGLQILNVCQGGTLIQHLQASQRHQWTGGRRDQPVHEVSIEKGTLLAEIAGKDRMQVNSRHHQAARTVGGNLRVSAVDANDGTVEALEHPGKRFVLAVQWHPEDQALHDAGQLKIFQRFGAALA